MKNIFTKIKKTSLSIFASVLLTGSIQATTYTATQSGNWSSALTWGGAGSPGNTVGTVDNVIIPAGMAVTMDMDVAVTSLASYITVTGTLTSTTNSLTITQGALQGTGAMNMFYVEIGALGSMTFSGTMITDFFVNSGATISTTAGIIINDSLILNSGSMAFNTGSLLRMNNNSNIKVAAGTMSNNGGVLVATSIYDLIYVGSSKTSGVETGISAGLNNMWVNLTDSNQILTMGSDVTVGNTMHHTFGEVVIGAHTLKLLGDYVSTLNGKIQSIATSRLMLESAASVTSAFKLGSASQFQYLEINLGTASTINFSSSFSVDTVYIKSGAASFTNASTLTIASAGVIIKENGTFALALANFNSTNLYSVIYRGATKISDFEIMGAGLQSVLIDLSAATNMVTMNSDLTVAGKLNMNMGSLNINSHNLYLTGTFSSTTNGTFRGNVSSNIFINNTTTAFGDTLNFASGVDFLDTLSINTMASTWVNLGNGLNVSSLVFKSGKIMLADGDLSIQSPGVITGYDSTKYVGTNGLGSLDMNINVAAPYVLFPVGTTTGYSPASLQVASGTAGIFHVNVQNGMLLNGTSGTNLALTQSVVNRTWFIQEPNQTGALSANVQVEWSTTDEMNSFDRTHSYISKYSAGIWDASTLVSAPPATGSYYRLIRNVSSFSPLAVADQNTFAGIEKPNATNLTVSIYPNPAANFVTIDFKNADAKTVEVFNEIGSKVYSMNVTDKNSAHKIDVSNLPAGVYYIKVATATTPIIKKMVKS